MLNEKIILKLALQITKNDLIITAVDNTSSTVGNLRPEIFQAGPQDLKEK